jgi:hypothetical protein
MHATDTVELMPLQDDENHSMARHTNGDPGPLDFAEVSQCVLYKWGRAGIRLRTLN